MPRPVHATIHPAALAHNLAQARAAAGGARIFGVVKANAYGHGIERVWPGLQAADGLALLDLAEAERVRALGWRGPVLLLEGVFEPRDLEACSRLNLWHVVHHAAQIDWLAAHKTQQAQRVFLKLNSGMNRLGFTPDAFRSAYTRLAALPQVDEISLVTHFSDADAPRRGVDGIAHQLAAWRRATEGLAGERSLANSAAVLRHADRLLASATGGVPADVPARQALAAEVRGDWVRAGILSYGSSPDHPAHSAADWGLQPVMTLASRLIATQQLQPGDSVGYGSRYSAERAMRIGIVACGYADGYPRHAPDGTPVLVDGVRTRLVGRVSMDMITVDLTPVPQADVGSTVTLWGRGPQGSLLPVDEVAQAAGTIGYELLCALAPRVPVTVDEAPLDA